MPYNDSQPSRRCKAIKNFTASVGCVGKESVDDFPSKLFCRF